MTIVIIWGGLIFLLSVLVFLCASVWHLSGAMDKQGKEIEQLQHDMGMSKKTISRMQGVIENIFTLSEKRNDRYKTEIEHLQSQINELKQ